MLYPYDLAIWMYDLIVMVIEFAGLFGCLPFIILSFMVGLNKNCPSGSVIAAHLFTALTALSLILFGSCLVIAKIKHVISILPIIPYAFFICYFILAVVAYVIKNVLLAKLAGGAFALSVLLLIALSVYLSILLVVSLVRLAKSSKTNQLINQINDAIDEADAD